MKLKHTQQKSANRSFDTRATGFENESYRKQINKITFSPDKSDRRFTKSSPNRKTIQRTVYPKY